MPEPIDFHVVSIEQISQGRFAVTWTSEPGKNYGVQYSSDLKDPWTELAETSGGDSATTSQEVTPNGTAGFIRVVEK